MRLLKITEFWELLHYGKCATEHFFLETFGQKVLGTVALWETFFPRNPQVKKLLPYHGNGQNISGIK